jgi:membrane-bound serine protease (ClpP class)
VPANRFAFKEKDPLRIQSLRVKKWLLLAFSVAAVAAPGAAASPRVLAIHFSTEVSPVTQDWLNAQLDHAQSRGYDAAVIVLDTPGGLEESMRKIVQKELSLKIPVIVYVSPKGARAASAGVWISEAADLLAMAPVTNIGSSTPITSSGQNIGKDLRKKVINDAAASLRSLAKSHGRNAAWADSAVRKASNLTETEALKLHVIDMLAPTLPALLAKAEGYKTKGPDRSFTLHLSGAEIVSVRPGFLTRFLNTLIDPNIVSLLVLAGIAGIGYEIFHPGVVLPGALGGVCLLTALFGFSVLPLSWAGLALVLLGIALLVIDLNFPTHGALTLSGLVAMGVGFATLFHNAPAPYTTSVPLVVTITVLVGGFWAIAVGKAVAVRKQPVAVGPQEIVGMEGVVREGGLVFVHGELWRVRSAEPLSPGERVQVDALDGLTLNVHRV